MSNPGQYSAAVLRKARAVPLEDIDERHDGSVYLVKSQRTGKSVRVQFLFDGEGELAWRTCTCTNGNKRGGQASCYHAAAAELLRREGSEADEPG